MKFVMRRLLILLPVLLSTSCWRGYAEGPEFPVAATDDPPARVARIGYTRGPVSLLPAGDQAWAAAELNRPLTTGDELWTDDDANAELDLGNAFVRLDSRTSVSILNLDDYGVQLSLLAGNMQVRLRSLDEDDEFEVDTPQASITLLRTGNYRIGTAAPEDGIDQTDVIVRSGQLEVGAPGQAFTVRAGQAASVTGLEEISYEITPAPPLDTFDDFCNTRDESVDEAAADEYVSPYVIGRRDLDPYGSWRVISPYGPVWFPSGMVVGWAPYRFGHWVWIAPWGWTWVDNAPWGFAPFHYGRWMFYRGAWGWVPGPRRMRALYAPALVVFAGGGANYQYYFSVGGGLGVGWFPLGPREVYLPPYRASRLYVTNINIGGTVISNPNNAWRVNPLRQNYVNRTVQGAFTAVPANVFRGAQPVGPAAVPVTVARARSARIGGMAPPVTANQQSLAMRTDAMVRRPPTRVAQRVPVVRTRPAPAPVPFSRQQPALDRDPGRPAGPQAVEEMRQSRPGDTGRYRQLPETSRQETARTSRAPRPTASGPNQPAAGSGPQPAARDSRGIEQRRTTIEQERRQGGGGAQPRQQPKQQPRQRGKGRSSAGGRGRGK